MPKHNYEWVSSVLQDLHNFAAENGLPDTADRINEARIEMCHELNRFYVVEKCSDRDRSVKGDFRDRGATILPFRLSALQTQREKLSRT